MPVTAPASQCESPCLMVICGAYTQFCVAAGFEIAARHHTIMRSIARLVSIRRVDWTSSSRLMITAQLMQPSLTDAHVAQIITACSLWDFDAPSHLEILFQLLVDQVLSTMSRANQWFVLADGIVREVITADITRYLGNDASVRPGMGTGEHEGRRGYWITAYRTLTSAMIDDLQADSRRWEQERRSSSSRNAYQDSRTHADRLHTGPSPSATYPPAAPYDRQPALSGSYVYGSRAGFGKYRDSYSSATVDYGGSQFDYPFVPSAVDPRTTLGPFGSQSSQPPVAFYSTPAPTPTSSPPGYYTASDGRQYPLPQQSQSPAGVNLPENRNSDRRKRSDVTPQATLATYSGTVDPPQTTAVSPTVMRYGKHSDDDGEGAGSMSSPYD